jgi:lipopolysaccharide/colanic/teichoic acid biosynthesis glycosyltransferase
VTTSTASQAQRRADRRRRAVDVVLGSILLVLALPVMVVVAIVCAVALRAQPVFVQDRIGRDGSTFRFVKLRTLRPSVPAYVDKTQLHLEEIPRLCRLVRRVHLDELPQLALVVRGRMSLVGPRPEMAHLNDALPADFAVERTSVRPGCTGFWQISDGCTGLIGESPEYDRFYVVHRSVRFDLWVLGHTILKMLGRPQFPGIDDVPSWVVEPVRDLVEVPLRHDAEPVPITVAAGR